MKYFKTGLFFSAIFYVAFFGFSNLAKADDSYDLAVESLTMNSAKCEIKKLCSFTARVKNLGSQFTLNFPIKSSAVSANKIDSQTSVSPERGTVIQTNDYITFALSGFYTKIGAVTLTFSVDPSGYLTESNTGNNSVSLTVEVVGYDLSVETITVLPAKPMPGQNCLIQVKARNNSTYNFYTGYGLEMKPVFADFLVANASSTEPNASKPVKSGDYFYYEYEGKFTSFGEKQLSITVDPDNVLKEVDMTNNVKTVQVTVYNPMDTDLAVNSVSFSVSKIIMKVPFNITIGVKNIGKTSLTDFSGLSKDEFGHNLSNIIYGVYDLIPDAYPTLSAPLNQGGIFYYKFHGTIGQSGNLNLNFLINKNKKLIEADYGNNATTTAVTVYKSQADADSFSVLSQSVSFASSTTAIISWTTDLKTTGVLNYGLDYYNNVKSNQVDAVESALEHSVTLDNLQAGGNYVYAITGKNGIVEKTEAVANFTMPKDNTLRLASGPSLGISDKNINFVWTTNLISSGFVYYKNKDAAAVISAGSDTASSQHRVEIKDLAYGRYDYFISSTSTPGANFKTGWASFEIKAAPLVSAPADAGAPLSVAPVAAVGFPITNNVLYEQLKGKIILRVQNKGEAYYVSPKDKKLYYLGRPEDAFPIIRSQAVGMTDANLGKIPVGLSALGGADADSDGLPDAFETAIGTNPEKNDTDGDGYNDKDELASGNSPLAKSQKLTFDNALVLKFKGKILLQVQGRGQAWYINPTDSKRYFLNRPADAFNLMRKLGVGVTNANYQAMGGK